VVTGSRCCIRSTGCTAPSQLLDRGILAEFSEFFGNLPETFFREAFEAASQDDFADFSGRLHFKFSLLGIKRLAVRFKLLQGSYGASVSGHVLVLLSPSDLLPADLHARASRV